MTASVQSALKEARIRLDEIYGDRLVHVVLYGSQARGDEHEESDVDVLVVLQDEIDILTELRRLTPLKLSLLDVFDEYFTFLPVSKALYTRHTHPLMINVQEEGIEL